MLAIIGILIFLIVLLMSVIYALFYYIRNSRVSNDETSPGDGLMSKEDYASAYDDGYQACLRAIKQMNETDLQLLRS